MFHADMEALRKVWPDKPVIDNAEDLFRVSVNMGQHGQFTADTHLFPGQPLRLLPYADFDSLSRDASGRKHPAGDASLAQAIRPGQMAFAIKHHRCEHRALSANSAEHDLKEHIKLQDSHIQIAIGVADRGRGIPGVVTLNSPQSYGGEGDTPGRFGAPDYPMIFVTPKLPDYVPRGLRQSFIDNITAMAVTFNAVSKFPGNGVYNGGDPLAASTPEKVIEHVKQMVLAIAGSEHQQQAALQWFEEPNHLIYCAEYAFLCTSAGCLCPLNRRFLDPLVGDEVAAQFIDILNRHNAGNNTRLSSSNPNKLVGFINTPAIPDELLPMADYAPVDKKPSEKMKLALQPLTAADILDHALSLHFDRRNQGESIAPIQAGVLQKMQSGLLDMLNLNQPDTNPEHREVAIAQFTKVVSIVAIPHANYDEFRHRLDPALQELSDSLTVAGDDSNQVTQFTPPSLFHVLARKDHSGGLLELDYLGHGLHLSLLHSDE